MHSKLVRQACPGKRLLLAPHVTLATAADHMHQKKHDWHKQEANSIGKSHGL